MGNIDSFMNIIIILAGLYLLYSAILMKTKGEVASGFMSRDIKWDQVKEENRKAFIKIMFPANIAMGIIMTGMGLFFTFGEKIGLPVMGESLIIGIALVFFVIYGAVLMNAQNKNLR
ncbi:MAG: hypothetical protein II966_01675 [Lachnospiraceae bacterium]|nr:hypothetical protein [Lachnospiraceae bacterium]